ncbi:MAG: hypothetical protein DGJ47_000300 [Rickettsiaceae bacterium]
MSKKQKSTLVLLVLVAIFCFYIILKNITMKINPQEAEKLRDELHNLDISSYETYYDQLYHITASGEGFSPRVYKDTKGKLTIGYGFNMDRGEAARHEWDGVFKDKISFDEAIEGKILVTEEQARGLKRYGIEAREKELKVIYSPYWHEMRLNERAIITDMYYQSPKLVGKGTKFLENVKKYYATNNEHYLNLAVKEIKENSSYSPNILERIGLQNRNNIRAIIFDSRECLLYSKPYDELIPVDKQLDIILGETVIPREVSDKYPKRNNWGDYYIWRTCKDSKVRSKHSKFEGKAFKHEDNIMHPGDDYGCRCKRERLPIHANVIEKETKMLEGGALHQGAIIPIINLIQ